jgi:hypothetical protein
MAKRLHKTLLDYLVIAISPAMIIVLINSLVQFLVEVFYRGGFEGRLEYVLTLFVIGAVLIGRISIEEGRERAMLFAAPLGMAIFLAICRFVTFTGALASFSFLINIGLIALIWWSADKLTWDCTLIDEQEEDSGEGLLETIGLDRPDHAAMQREIAPVPDPDPEATTSRDDVPTSWWGRFVERRRRPHAPGVWVVYFSLAALPLFGLGELLIPKGDAATRQDAFRHLFSYTACGLGLLLSTSFLGLRRYLRQRRQEMPLTMVNLWLGIGVSLIIAVMMVAMLLPRPNAEYAISELPFGVGSPDQNASPEGMGKEGVEEDRPDARLEPRDDAKDDAPQSNQSGKSNPADSKDAQKTKSGQESSKDQGKADEKSADEKAGQKSADSRKEPSNDGQESGKSADDKDGKKQGDSKDEARNPGEAGKNHPAGDNAESEKKQPPKGEADKEKKPFGGSGTAETKRPETEPPRREEGSRRSGDAPRAPAVPHIAVPQGFSAFAVLFKWILYIALAAVVVYAVWKNRVELLAALREWRQILADFWHKLFGGKPREADEAAAEEIAKGKPLPRFADFSDPFAAGTAGRYRPEELVRYTFEALEAWARDHGHSRLPDETPHEFARSLAGSAASLADDARLLADLYCQVAYAPGALQVAMVTRLPRLWQGMRTAGGQHVSPAAE